MKITWILALAALALSACATTSKYEAVLASWVGSTENELVASWGPPAGLYTTPDGSRVLTYNSEGNMYLPGTAPTYQSTIIGNTVYTKPVGGVAPTNIHLSCKTNFTVVNGRITTWRWQGNNCTSR